jgi:hypothetical protein
MFSFRRAFMLLGFAGGLLFGAAEAPGAIAVERKADPATASHTAEFDRLQRELVRQMAEIGPLLKWLEALKDTYARGRVEDNAASLREALRADIERKLEAQRVLELDFDRLRRTQYKIALISVIGDVRAAGMSMSTHPEHLALQRRMIFSNKSTAFRKNARDLLRAEEAAYKALLETRLSDRRRVVYSACAAAVMLLAVILAAWRFSRGGDAGSAG